MRQKTKAILTVLLIVVATGLISVTSSPAQDQQEQPDQGVGRISVLDGNVSTRRGDSGDWVADTINTPVVPGDELSTGPQSRTEVQLDYANVLRMSENTRVKVAGLSQGGIQLQVGQGLVEYAVIRDNQGNVEIDAPNLAIHPLGRGTYRIQVDSPTETLVTVRQGEVQVSTSEGSTNVRKGETITVQGSENPEYKIEEAQGRDDWDRWNEDRDKTILEARSWQHTDPYYTGSSDLDDHGHWVSVPGYDYAWQPSVGPDWAPYSDGSWVWEPYWGWTWVSAEPWGWAPYHYGRWFMWNNAWTWWPGPIGGFGLGWYQPVWAPAYVSFFGFGGGWGFGFGFGYGGGWGFGSIGWLPIGPCDPFVPWWGHGHGFNVVNVNNITNITNITNIRNINGAMPPLASTNQPAFSNLRQAFTSQRMRQGITTVAGNRFGQGPVRGARQPVTDAMLHGSSLVAGRLPVVPTKASLSPINRPAAANSIPRAGSVPTRFAGTQPRLPAGQSFAQQAAGVRQMVQGLNSQSVTQQGRTTAEQLNRMPFSNRAPQVAGDTSQQSVSGANRAFAGGNPAVAGRSGAQTAPSNQAAGSGWQRFQSQGGARGTAPGYNAAPSSRALGEAARTAPHGGATQQGWERFQTQGGARGTAPSYNAGAPSRGFNETTRPAPQGGVPQQASGGFSQQSAPRSSFEGNRPSFVPRSAPGGSGGSWNYNSGGGRPPLQMSRPMVVPRSSPGSGGHSGYGGGSMRGYSGGARSYGGYSGGGHSFGGLSGGGHSSSGGGSRGGGSRR